MEIRRIVDSMSTEDILDVYSQDASYVNHKIKDLNKRFSKCLYSSRKEIFFFPPAEYKRKDGLNIIVQCFDMGSAVPIKQRLRTTFYFWFIYRNGFHAIRILSESKYSAILYFYTPHFIDRYRERGLKDTSISKPEALNKFICNNHKIVGKRIRSEKYPDNFWLCYEEGIAFVNSRFFKKSGILFSELTMKTFISWDCLSLKRRKISFSLFKEALSNGYEIKIPDEILDKD